MSRLGGAGLGGELRHVRERLHAVEVEPLEQRVEFTADRFHHLRRSC